MKSKLLCLLMMTALLGTACVDKLDEPVMSKPIASCEPISETGPVAMVDATVRRPEAQKSEKELAAVEVGTWSPDPVPTEVIARQREYLEAADQLERRWQGSAIALAEAKAELKRVTLAR